MTINNVKFKAADAGTTIPTTIPETSASMTIEQAKAYQKQIDDIIQVQFKQAESYSQYLTSGENAKRSNLQAELKAISLELDIFIKTGKMPSDFGTGGVAGAAGAAGSAAAVIFPEWETAKGGWYTFGASSNLTQPAAKLDAGDEEMVGENYAGTFNIDATSAKDANGNIIPTNLWFVMNSDTEAISGRNMGNDIVVTVTYTDGHSEDYVIKNGAIRNDIQIGVNALKVEGHGVKMDFSKVAIVNQKTGEKGGIYLIGSKNDDDIKGSAGVDSIHGAGGNDTLDGMGGSDKVYGYASSGDYSGDGIKDGVLDVFGAEKLGTDGDDTIFDLYGNDTMTSDTIVGGAGTDTVVRAADAKNPIAAQEVEAESTIPTSDPSDIEGWFAAPGWSIDASGEELVLTKDGTSSSSINLDMEEGYMLSSSRSGNDMVMTIMYPGEDGSEPIYYRAIVKDYFNQKTTSLTINNAGFADMSQVNVGTNSVAINGTGNDGDVLVGPKTIFEEYAITADTLGTSNVSDGDIESMLSTWKSNDAESDSVWYAVANESDGCSYNNGVITVPAGSIGADGTFDVPTDLGAVAFVQTKDGRTQITIVSNKGIEPKSVVINIEGQVPANFKVTLNGSKSEVYNLNSKAGVTLNGAEGRDFLGGYQFGTTFADENDSGTEIGVPTPADHIATPSAQTEDDMLDKINTATKFTTLNQYESKVSKMKDADEKEELQNAIDERRKELIEIEMGREAATVAELEALKIQIAKLSDGDIDINSLELQLQDKIDAKKEAADA